MIRYLLLTFLAVAQPCFGEVTFDWAHVGNAGNAPDPATGFGAVSYNYAIGKHEVTNAQYVRFLNAVDPTGSNVLGLFTDSGLYDGLPGDFGGIEKTGVTDGARYVAIAGRGNKPVTSVSFLDAMRFVNWLHNGQQDADTESGVYSLGEPQSWVRSPGASVWVTTRDEWYKAAYHDASAGQAGTYFRYATGSNSVPVSDMPNDNPAAVNYFNDDGVANGFNDGFAVSGSIVFPEGVHPFTDVGAYSEASSPYGTFDQNGNVEEWHGGIPRALGRDFLGGWAHSGPLNLQPRGFENSVSPDLESVSLGFRIASIPQLAQMPAGDYDMDGMVGAGDRSAWAAGYASIGVSLADGNADGVINAADYTIYRDALATPSQPTTVPEPNTAALATLAVTALAARRR